MQLNQYVHNMSLLNDAGVGIGMCVIHYCDVRNHSNVCNTLLLLILTHKQTT